MFLALVWRVLYRPYLLKYLRPYFSYKQLDHWPPYNWWLLRKPRKLGHHNLNRRDEGAQDPLGKLAGNRAKLTVLEVTAKLTKFIEILKTEFSCYVYSV